MIVALVVSDCLYFLKYVAVFSGHFHNPDEKWVCRLNVPAFVCLSNLRGWAWSGRCLQSRWGRVTGSRRGGRCHQAKQVEEPALEWPAPGGGNVISVTENRLLAPAGRESIRTGEGRSWSCKQWSRLLSRNIILL